MTTHSRLYRATLFPTQWQFVKALLSSADVDESGEVSPGTATPGFLLPSLFIKLDTRMTFCSIRHFQFADTSPLLYNGRWYLFTFVKPTSSLHIYYSGILFLRHHIIAQD